MRKQIRSQMLIGEVNISQIKFDPKSRDDIPDLLRGLQYIYAQEAARKKIFEILETGILPDTDRENGRPGMSLWRILVMGVLRLNLNWDYDRLHEMANQHKQIREMLGHGYFDEDANYHLQTIKDNVALLTPEILDQINEVVVKCAHKVVKKKECLKTRCDTFVVKTNVHFPTDTNLLYDAIRKVVILTAQACERSNISGWRQYKHLIRKMKGQLRHLQKIKRSSSKNPNKKAQKERQIQLSYSRYTGLAQQLIDKAKETQKLLALEQTNLASIEVVQMFIAHAERQIDQIIRRVIKNEAIPHAEKVFSIFESHTEWISKGKAGVPVELGLAVAVLEDEFGFFLSHQVLQKETDKDIAVPLLKKAKSKYPEIHSCSFDKGFHSKENQEQLRESLNVVALPKKGRRSKADQEWEHSAEFIAAKAKHSAVESAINALGIHGLDKCPDRGLHGFKRYVSLAILARNAQKLGAVLRKLEQKQEERMRKKQRFKEAA